MGHLINVLAKYIQGLFGRSVDSDEKKPNSIIIQFILISVFAIPYAFVLLPPDITVVQIISAFVAFLLIVVFAFRVLKYFKILDLYITAKGSPYSQVTLPPRSKVSISCMSPSSIVKVKSKLFFIRSICTLFGRIA